MIGFIKKDIAVMKSNIKILVLLTLLYVAMGIFGDMDISFILPFMVVMVMIQTFSYDSFNNWNAYSLSLPNGRKNSVRAKYITTIIMILIATIITFILSCAISYLTTKSIPIEKIGFTMLGTVFGTILMLVLMYPIIYKLGVEKARIAIFIMVFGLIGVGGLLLSFIDLSVVGKTLSFLEGYIIEILILLGILMVYISYRISLKTFSKKEF